MNLPPGYTSRPATLDDLEAIVELVQTIDRTDLGFVDPVRDELAFDWSTVGFRIERDTRSVLHGDGRIVAYADVVAHDPSRQISSWVQVHPEHRGRGIGSALADWLESHARGRLPAGASDVPLRNGAASTNTAGATPLRRRGFEHVRSFWHMERSLATDEPEPPTVAGVAYRASRRGWDDRAIYDILDRSFREHFGYEPYSFEDWGQEWFSDPNYDPGLVPSPSPAASRSASA